MKRKSISILLILTLVLTMCLGSVGSASAASYSDVKAAWEKTGENLYNTVKEPAFGSVGGEWLMYGLAEAGYVFPDSYVNSYQKTVEAALEEGYRGVKGILHDRKYTEYARVIVTYGQLGLDPSKVGGVNLLEFLADLDAVKWQGINGPIWALQALDSGDFDIPSMKGKTSKFASTAGEPIKNVTTRQKLINCILEKGIEEHGFYA